MKYNKPLAEVVSFDFEEFMTISGYTNDYGMTCTAGYSQGSWCAIVSWQSGASCNNYGCNPHSSGDEYGCEEVDRLGNQGYLTCGHF